MQAWGRQLGDLLLMATDHAEPETLRALGLRDEQVVVVPDLLARADSSEDRFERLEGRGLLTAADADCGRVPYRQLEECFTACSALPSCVAFVDNYQAQPPFCRCTTRVGTMSDMPGEMTIYLKESAFDRVELRGPLPPREQPHVPEWRGGPAVAEPHELPSLTLGGQLGCCRQVTAGCVIAWTGTSCWTMTPFYASTCCVDCWPSSTQAGRS